MKKIILIVLFFNILNSNAQRFISDSLLRLIKTAKEDSVKIDAANAIPFGYYTPDSVLFYSKKIIEEGNRQKDDNLIALGRCQLGYGYYRSGNQPKALEAELTALKIAEKTNNPVVLATIYENLGLSLLKTDLKKAEFYLRKGVDIVNQSSPNRFYNIAIGNYARLFFLTNRLDSALLYVQKAYMLANMFNRTGGRLSYNLAMFQYNTLAGQNEVAITYARLALKDAEEANIFPIKYRVDVQMGDFFDKVNITDSALHYYNLAFETAGKTKNIGDYIKPSNWLYNYYKGKNKIDKAFYYIETFKNANDSANNINNVVEAQSLALEEDLRQKDLNEEKRKMAEERKNNLQFAAITIGLITFIVLFFLLSRSIIVKTKFIEFFGVLGLLAVFEFINLLIHPYLAHATNDSPVLMLLVLIAIGALLVPLHHKLEKWMTSIMVEKNKKIRLEAAKKTIATLEGEQTN